MPMFNCNAWVHPDGDINQFDWFVPDKKIFSSTRPNAITKFVDGEVLPMASELLYDLADVHISVETLPTVPNWRP